MKFKNFNLVRLPEQQIIEIRFLGNLFDLHNAAEFTKIEYDIINKKISLFWAYYKENEVINFKLIISTVSSCKIVPINLNYTLNENDTLEEIKINGEEITFIFMDGMKFSVIGENAEIEIIEN